MTEIRKTPANIWDTYWQDGRPIPTSDEKYRTMVAAHTVDFFLAKGITFSQGQKVLECGCGDGEVALAIASRFPVHVTGIDSSSQGCQTTKKRTEDLDLRIEIVQGDARKLPLAGNMFDKIVSLGVIEHDVDPIGQLKELARVIKPNGTLILMTPNLWSFAKLDRVWREARGRWPIGYQREFSPDQLCRMCAQAGFTKMSTAVSLLEKTASGTAPIDKVAHYDALVSRLFRTRKWGFSSWVFAQKGSPS